jgi:RNA polymerase sigma-70 factor (ECF subfamily)
MTPVPPRPPEGDHRFECLFNRYYRPVIAYLMRDFGLSLEDARELTQETFLRVYTHMEGYRGDAQWMFLKTTAHNVVANHFRGLDTDKRRRIDVSMDAAGDPPAPEPPADVKLIEKEKNAAFRKRLTEALAELPEITRHCVLLRGRGYSYDEIRIRLDLSLDAVKSRLKDAKKRLRARIGDVPEGIDGTDVLGEDFDDREG